MKAINFLLPFLFTVFISCSGNPTLYELQQSAKSVSAVVPSISITPVSFTLEKGSTETLQVVSSTTSSSLQGAIWSSSDSSIATVDSSGVVTGVSVGAAVITLMSSNKTSSASSTVTVIDSDSLIVNLSFQDFESLSLSANASLSLKLGDTLTITPSFASGTNWLWSIYTLDGSKIFTSSDSSLNFTPTAAGTYDITLIVTGTSATYSENLKLIVKDEL